MEYVSILAGEPFSDHPECTLAVLAEAARRTNDQLGDWDRHLIVPAIGRLFGTRADAATDERLALDLARWAARSALPKITHPHVRSQCQHLLALDPRTFVIDDDPRIRAIKMHATLYYAGVDSIAYNAAWATINLLYVQTWYRHATVSPVTIISGACAVVAHAFSVFPTGDNGEGALLSGLLDEYDRLTGRTEAHVLTPQEQSLLMAVAQ